MAIFRNLRRLAPGRISSAMCFCPLILLSCNEPNETGSIKAAHLPNTTQTLNRDSVNLDIRVRQFINAQLSKSDHALALYTPECWIEDCSPRGFVISKRGESIELVIFRLKAIYQQVTYRDTAVFVGLVFQDKELRGINDIAASYFDAALDEFTSKKIPFEGQIGISHDNTFHVWYKKGSIQNETVTKESTIFFNRDSSYINTTFLFRTIDSNVRRAFDSSNNDTLDVNYNRSI